jgi:carbon monoxide dehydrogenase subunit G
MTDTTNFESRTGTVSCSAEEVFNFVTDIRNFEQFLPEGTINNLVADKESCSFNVAMIGKVSFRLTEKKQFSRVEFEGDALSKEDFRLILDIIDDGTNPVKVKVFVNAVLNPMLKMMAKKPIQQFLEMLVVEMENFRGWSGIRE